MYRSVWKNPTVEKALPWCLWATGYGMTTLVVVLRWTGQYQDLVYPVAGICLHATVALMTRRKVAALARVR